MIDIIALAVNVNDRESEDLHAWAGQAVRLPKEFRLPGKEVRVSKVGDKVILEPLEKAPLNVAAWRAALVAAGPRLPGRGLPEDQPAGGRRHFVRLTQCSALTPMS